MVLISLADNETVAPSPIESWSLASFESLSSEPWKISPSLSVQSRKTRHSFLSRHPIRSLVSTRTDDTLPIAEALIGQWSPGIAKRRAKGCRPCRLLRRHPPRPRWAVERFQDDSDTLPSARFYTLHSVFYPRSPHRADCARTMVISLCFTASSKLQVCCIACALPLAESTGISKIKAGTRIGFIRDSSKKKRGGEAVSTSRRHRRQGMKKDGIPYLMHRPARGLRLSNLPLKRARCIKDRRKNLSSSTRFTSSKKKRVDESDRSPSRCRAILSSF